MTKNFSQQQTLTIEHDRKIQQRQTLTSPPKNMLMRLSWTGPPALARKLTMDIIFSCELSKLE